MSSQWIEKLEVIGNGSFGRVFKCRDLRTGECVAVKEIDLDEGGGDSFDELRAEISTLMSCDHPNIIRYRASYVPNYSHFKTNKSKDLISPLSNRLCIVMDYCARGSLRQVLDQHGPLSEHLVTEVAESILKALEYLHKQGISHRDLKGANVLVDEGGRVKLGDFGVALKPSSEEDYKDKKLVGSPYWMAPEVLSLAHIYDASKADIWSFGITLIELLKGRPPLHYLSSKEAMETIPLTSPPRLESDDPHASKLLRELIHACLHDDPRRRPTASQLLKSYKSYFKQRNNLNSAAISSLSRLNLNLTKEIDIVHKSSNVNVNETIFSQWDFDLNTFRGTFTSSSSLHSIDNNINRSIENELKSVTEVIIDLDSITTKTQNILELDTKEKDNNILNNVTRTKDKPMFRTRNLNNFLTETNKTSNSKFKSNHHESEISDKRKSGWENKDLSILPIPRPQDAPDLSVPQFIQFLEKNDRTNEKKSTIKIQNLMKEYLSTNDPKILDELKICL